MSKEKTKFRCSLPQKDRQLNILSRVLRGVSQIRKEAPSLTSCESPTTTRPFTTRTSLNNTLKNPLTGNTLSICPLRGKITIDNILATNVWQKLILTPTKECGMQPHKSGCQL
ncbi:hypothetical protein DINM_003278 [Dirofilaria immitis]|nr:hypothetical protein [Dirofilaria immitis]